jgi:hypothetical protein
MLESPTGRDIQSVDVASWLTLESERVLLEENPGDRRQDIPSVDITSRLAWGSERALLGEDPGDFRRKENGRNRRDWGIVDNTTFEGDTETS